MASPLITVIIPIYNAAPYLRTCLDSVIAQSYTHLQILLIDDGSTDDSHEICREYAAQDRRIQVIRQDNCGVSAARNTGLAHATGQWIGWADPDDSLEPDLFSYLLQGVQTTNADISLCGWYEERPGHSAPLGWPTQEVLDRNSALEALLQDEHMPSFLWNKLWRRELFDGLHFPEGRIYEDVDLCWQLFLRAERIACLPAPKYHYIRRPDSLSGEWSVHKLLDFYLAARDRYDGLIHTCPQHRRLLERDCVRLAFLIGHLCFSTDRKHRQTHRRTLTEMARFALSRPDKQGYDQRRSVRILLRCYAAGSPPGYFLANTLIYMYTKQKGNQSP